MSILNERLKDYIQGYERKWVDTIDLSPCGIQHITEKKMIKELEFFIEDI